MPVAGPFYLAWVDPTETTFNSEHYRMDEYVFSARRTLSEGQKPLLEIEIENPGEGLLSTGRKLWAWFAWDNGTAIVPLFFGRVLGAPVAINKETLVVQLVASPADYKQRVQMAAEALKVLPYYDPVFISVGERDNPDTILETRASFWDIDPITLAVSAVSIIEGPDGTVNVTDHFYDSLDNTVSQPPATAILMDASVSWTQAYKGVLPDPLSASIFSYGGDAIISDWPRPNAQLGGGWQVFDSAATPSAGMNPEMVTDGFTWQNTALHHEDGDTMSVSYSTTFPLGAGEGFVTSYTQQTGFADPFHIDDDGDVSPINIPASFQAQLAWPISGTVGSMLSLKYTAGRTRTERVKFLVRADMQEVIVDPTVDQDSEVMTLSGADVSMPLINMRNWSSIAGTFVPLGSVIFPDNPDLPGSQTAQIATHEGTAGTVEPGFSDVPGVTTADGSGLVWSSLGQASPPENSRDWQADTNIPTGTIILPRRPDYITMDQLLRPGLVMVPKEHDPSVSEGQIILYPDGHYRICTLGGTLNGATFFDLGTTLPSGNTYQVAIQGGRTGAQYHIPPFSDTPNTTTTDNSVIWACINVGDVPIGGTPGMVPAASYFPTDRGLQSLMYLALRVRSRLLWRGRCSDVSFDVDYAQGVSFTTRKMVTITDPRLPGGVAVGKMKTAVLTIDGGTASCHVTIGCTLGKNNVVSAVAGTTTYVDGYVDGYQVNAGQYNLLPSGSDLAFAPPVYVAEDDGLTFPLTNSQVVQFAGVRGDIAAQTAAVQSVLKTMLDAAKLVQTTPVRTLEELAARQQAQAQLLADNSMQKALQDNPVWYEVVLKPLTGTFHKLYNVKFSKLTMGKGIDLGS